MSMNSNIDRFGGKSIVPIRCYETQGTGFYIGNNCFLTAYHVVSDAEYDNSAIIATINNKEYPCSLIKLSHMDVALLKSYEDIDEYIIEPIKLLNSPFKEGLELQIIGYPQEIGNGVDYFNINVKNIRKLSNSDRGFDVMVQRTDAFGFYSYSGFSGSPVLNEFGYAIGVVTDQIHKTLGYTSVMSIVEELSSINVHVYSNADELDTRPYGIGTCIKMAEKSINKVRSRYNEICHVEDCDFENYIAKFCGIDKGTAQKELREEYKKWYDRLPEADRVFCNKYEAFKEYLETGVMREKFFYSLETIALDSENNTKENNRLSSSYLRSFHKLMDKTLEVLDIERVNKERFLYITGKAGCGKTQQLSHTVKKICNKTNVYLFFGTDFNSTEDPLYTIAKILSWPKETFLAELNEEMIKCNRYAIFILDALNEGEGTFYWLDRLHWIRSEMEEYERLKLVISVRTMEKDDRLRTVIEKGNWREWTFSGFRSDEKCKEALNKYFEYCNIHESPSNFMAYDLFRTPLFVKMFCDVYHSLPYEARNDIDLLLLYRIYFRKRNEEVSRLADEDPELDVTSRLLYKIGKYSLNSCLCCDVPRDIAVGIANKICKHRAWSKNLYHSAIMSNMLVEYKTTVGNMATFEFDNMGDYVRANVILLENDTDEKRYNAILKLVNRYEEEKNLKCKYQIQHTICAFLSVWNPERSYWMRPEMKCAFLNSVLLESLSNRNLSSTNSTLTDELVEDLISCNDNILNINYIFQHFKLFKAKLMSKLHDLLNAMSMLERDEKWTVGINILYDTHRFRSTINSVTLYDKDDVKIYINILCWMMSSSHPSVRNHLIRVVKGLLEEHIEMCVAFIELFHKVNDPYILYGLYAAIYGVILTRNDKKIVHDIANKIYEYHYKNQINVPSEISVRIWTLKMLEYNNYINPEDEYWGLSQPPYEAKSNLIENFQYENFSDENYFGEGEGAFRLHNSLFEGDFYRYVIGTNNNSTSSVFIKDGAGVSLVEMTKAVAYRIKHIYKYSTVLSDYDKHVKWESSSFRTIERIGKKYQWIALGEIKAYLSDTCNMRKGWKSAELAEKPYPWYSDWQSYFDPTFSLSSNHITLDNDMFNYFSNEEFALGTWDEWIGSKDIMPQTNIVVKDKKDTDWVVLVGYQKNEEISENKNRESFLYYSPYLVRKCDSEKFSEWASRQNFYGRWMPEDTGTHQYLWSEYPWSDLCILYESKETEIWRNTPECTVLLPYAAQYQENRTAIYDEEDINSTVYMPLRKMYEQFGLRNAERGVVRDKSGEIVAINRNIHGDSFNGLVVKRDLLNAFLESGEYELFYCNLGEKLIRENMQVVGIQRLSSCYMYIQDGEPKIIQKMTDERDLIEPETKPPIKPQGLLFEALIRAMCEEDDD